MDSVRDVDKAIVLAIQSSDRVKVHTSVFMRVAMKYTTMETRYPKCNEH